MSSSKEHWEKIYYTKQPHEVSWTENVPAISLNFIHSFNLSKSAGIIDVGGGDSRLVDFLLAEGFKNITVLDLSTKALERAKERLGKDSQKVNWITADITAFNPDTNYDLWHDRAAFHFLTAKREIDKYISTAKRAVKEGGYVTIGTFSINGPKKCSGLDVKQYSEESYRRTA